MPSQSFIRIFEEHYTVFRTLFAESVTNPSQEVIHCMRREIKYLIALIHFVEELAPDNQENDLLNSIKRIGKKSGKVRDWQIIRMLMSSRPEYDNSSIMTEIDAKILDKQQRYRDFAKEVTIRLHPSDGLTLDQIPLSPASFIIYIGQMHHRIVVMLNKGEQNREFWHKARHLSKRSYHLMNLTNRLFPNSFQPESIQQMRQLEKLIGNWHDLVILGDFCESEQLTVAESVRQQIETFEKDIIDHSIRMV